MSNSKPPIVIITPVKNEGWIIDRFLAVNSQFADYIIIADQNSTDETQEIYRKYPHIHLIKNESEKYNEATRQIMLLEKARELVKGKKIILALDADEILAANATQTEGWQKMLQAESGTVLAFEKPNLYQTTKQCLRLDDPFPLGYIDDGENNQKIMLRGFASKNHIWLEDKMDKTEFSSTKSLPFLYIKDVKILHYALTRLDAQNSKRRFYSVIETSLYGNSIKSVFRRRTGYQKKYDFREKRSLETSPLEWFQKWEEKGIDMHNIPRPEYYWWDFQVLKEFANYGEKKFWFDNIWYFDWEKCRQYALNIGLNNVPKNPIQTPSLLLNNVLNFGDFLYKKYRNLD